MRNKFPRSIEPFFPPNLDVCYWAPGYGGDTVIPVGLNTGSFGIFDPNALSADQQFALANSTISTPFDISSYLDLPSTYSDLSCRPMSIMATPPTNGHHWNAFTIIVTGLDLFGNVQTDTSITPLVDDQTTIMTISFKYITQVQIYNHTGTHVLPNSTLLFDPGYYGTSRMFFPNPKNTSFVSNNSFQVFLTNVAGSPTDNQNYYLYGNNMPVNVNSNINPLTGPQPDLSNPSFLQLWDAVGFILPGWFDNGVPGQVSPLNVANNAPIPFPVNSFNFVMQSNNEPQDATQTSDGMYGYLIFNQFGQWFR